MIFNILGKKLDTSKILDGNIRPIAEMTFSGYNDGIADEETVRIYLEKFPDIIIEEEEKGTKEKDKPEKVIQKYAKEKEEPKEVIQKPTKEEIPKEKEKREVKKEDIKPKIDLQKKDISKTRKKVQELTGEEFLKADDVLNKIFEVLNQYIKKKSPKTKRKSSPSKSLSEVLAKESFDAINRVVTKELKNPKRIKQIDVKALKEVEVQGIEYIQSVAKSVGGIKDDASAPVREYKASMKTLIQRVEDALKKHKKK